MTSLTTHDNLADDILTNDGREILKDELSSPVFSNLAEIDALFPTFSRREVQFGPVLGVGASGVVREVRNIDLLDESHCSFSTFRTSLSTNSGNDSVANGSQAESENDIDNENEREFENLNYHYSSQNGVASLCRRNGEARYAVKSLMLEDACAEQQARARIDLAIEVSYLKVLSHPHIVKIRGSLNTSNLIDPKFFFLMDRLYGTLHDKIGEWNQSLGKKNIDVMSFVLKPFFRRTRNYNWNQEFMKERLFVAHDIASAFSYMHSNKVIHRDIKTQNIGFDIRGNIKVFDFGLATSLRDDRLSSCDYYNLTANVGSIPYMAPEVSLRKPYNEKCDVFSFGILLYEIMSLKPAFPEAIAQNYSTLVAKGGKRPRIKPKWPSRTKEIMKSSWMSSPIARPSMESICRMIKIDLQELETEEHIASRIECIANISRHSSSRFYNLDNSILDKSRHEFSFQIASLDEINED